MHFCCLFTHDVVTEYMSGDYFSLSVFKDLYHRDKYKSFLFTWRKINIMKSLHSQIPYYPSHEYAWANYMSSIKQGSLVLFGKSNA